MEFLIWKLKIKEKTKESKAGNCAPKAGVLKLNFHARNEKRQFFRAKLDFGLMFVDPTKQKIMGLFF